MKARLVIACGCAALLISGYSFGGCGGSGGCGGGGGDGYCGESEYVNTCQCTDPSCNKSYGHECLSRSECCEAFGNIGAR